MTCLNEKLFTQVEWVVPQTDNFFLPSLSDLRRPSKPQQSANANSMSASRRGNEVDTIVKSSKLSASAPEFVPSGINQYEVRWIFKIPLSLNILHEHNICGILDLCFMFVLWLLYRKTLFMMTAKAITVNQPWLIWSQSSLATWAPHQGPLSRILNT